MLDSVDATIMWAFSLIGTEPARDVDRDGANEELSILLADRDCAGFQLM